MAEIWVHVEEDGGAVAPITLEILSKVRTLGVDVVAVALGSSTQQAAKLGEYGATRVLADGRAEHNDYFSLPQVDAIAALVVLGAGGTGAAFLIFYTLNADIGPGRASVVAYIAPVFSVFYGVILLDEDFTIGTAAGLVLILVGSWMAADGRLPWRRRRSAPLATEAPA